MPPFEIDLFFLPSSAHNFYKYWCFLSNFQEKCLNIIFIQWKCILDICWPTSIYYRAKKCRIRETSVTFSKYDLLQFFFVCKFFTNIGKLYLKRKKIACSFQIWSKNWKISSSKKSYEGKCENLWFFCVRNHFKRVQLGTKLWL